MNKIEIAEGVELEVFHTLFTGQTNLAGKTTAIRSIIPKLNEAGFTVLIFDTKPTVREFPGYHDVPVTYRPTTDPLVLIGLLEAIRHARLGMLYSTLGRIAQGTKDISGIIQNSEKMEAKAKSGFVRDACWQLRDLLVRLNEELQNYHLSSTLELKQNSVNVMPLNGMSEEAQQLAIKTAFELALKHHNKNTILIIDEAFRFLPQDYSSACKRPVQDVVTQGAKTGLFVWLATQFIATTDKAAIKAMANKFLGRQDEDTEIVATIKRTRGYLRLKPEQLMTLKRGEFIFIPLEGEARKVYIPMSNQPIVSDAIPTASNMTFTELAKPIVEAMKTVISSRKSLKELDHTDPSQTTTVESDGTFTKPLTVGNGETLTVGSKKAFVASSATREIDLEVKDLTLLIRHTQKIVRESTDSLLGATIFGLQKLNRPCSQPDIIKEAAEYGIAINPGSLRVTMPKFLKESLVIQDGALYRLPLHVTHEIKQEIPA